MKHYIISESGENLGPFELSELNIWASDGRLKSSQMLSESSSMEQIQTSSLQGISWPLGQTTVYPRANLNAPAQGVSGVSWADKTFTLNSFPILIIFSIVCGGPALLFSILQLVAGKDTEARRKAKVCFGISFVMVLFWNLQRFNR